MSAVFRSISIALVIAAACGGWVRAEEASPSAGVSKSLIPLINLAKLDALEGMRVATASLRKAGHREVRNMPMTIDPLTQARENLCKCG